MVPTDPVNLLDPSPFGPFSYYGHIGIGLVGWVAAAIALTAKKGSPTHVWAGRLFILCILIVAITSLILLSTRAAPPLMVAAITSVYAVATAYLALQPATRTVRRTEYGLFGAEILLLMVFAAGASANIAAGNIPAIGPIMIAAIPVILLVGDINFFRKASQRSRLRIRRHLSRMIWAVVIAVRAPVTEFYSAFSLPFGLILFGPLIITPLIIWYFLRKQPKLTRSKAHSTAFSP